eukprot:3467915-Alexandrium_andersonii.AAC.1
MSVFVGRRGSRLLSECMADSPGRQGWTSATKAKWDRVRTASKRAPSGPIEALWRSPPLPNERVGIR